MKRAPLLLTAALALSATLGCGPQFDLSSELKSLRVLTVKKDKPYAQPGETVKMQMLWHDAKGPRPVQRVFIGGCFNPPADLYYACFPQLAELAAEGTLPLSAGDTFETSLPSDLISSRGAVDPGQDPYGLAIVFFAVCAGSLSLDASSTGDTSYGLPVRCLDDEGQPLGSDDFVVGYTSVYSFLGVENHNPTFTLDSESGATQFMIAGESAPADCVGEACQDAADVEVDCSVEGEARCIASCEDDGEPSCPALQIAPLIDETVEEDPRTSELVGAPTGEQMWVNYYVDQGSISEVRLVNDATTGWNAAYRGELRAPKATGPMKVWAVVHDNRGGIDFARITLMVE
jgi:hypothetical protein